jgi:hypothetical protein
VYRLSTAATCAQRLAGFAGQLVLVTDGKIYRRVPEAEVPQPTAAADAGAAAAVDAGTAARVADAGTAASGTATANAGEGGADGGVQQYPYIPGAPLPAGAQFPGETAAADAGY